MVFLTLNKGYCIVLNIQLQNVHVKYKFILISLWLFLAVFLQKKCIYNCEVKIMHKYWSCHFFYTPVSRRGRIMWLGMAGGMRPHRFPHDNFSSVYQIFTRLGHMIPLWKEKNPIYFGVIRSKVKVTVTYYKYNFSQQDRFCTITLVLYIGSLTNLVTWFPCGRGRTLFIVGH